LTAWAAAVLALAPSALAVDGTVHVNQNTSVNGLPGCPHSGFPIITCQSGSYRLSGNLGVTDADIDGIRITANNVTCLTFPLLFLLPGITSGNPRFAAPLPPVPARPSLDSLAFPGPKDMS